MKELFIIGNWKSNKTLAEAREWLDYLNGHANGLSDLEGKTVIVCPPFTLLQFMFHYIQEKELPIKLGAQDISPFPKGAFTGEINGDQIKEFADYVLIGHSERRIHFQEDYEVLKDKVLHAQESELQSIYCVPNSDSPVPPELSFTAYEPLDAISTSGAKPVTPEHTNEVCKSYKEEKNVYYPLYGGSVTPENVKTYSDQEFINGFLVGSASLDPQKFLNLIKNA